MLKPPSSHWGIYFIIHSFDYASRAPWPSVLLLFYPHFFILSTPMGQEFSRIPYPSRPAFILLFTLLIIPLAFSTASFLSTLFQPFYTNGTGIFSNSLSI
jgi:hypothetical protein